MSISPLAEHAATQRAAVDGHQVARILLGDGVEPLAERDRDRVAQQQHRRLLRRWRRRQRCLGRERTQVGRRLGRGRRRRRRDDAASTTPTTARPSPRRSSAAAALAGGVPAPLVASTSPARSAAASTGAVNAGLGNVERAPTDRPFDQVVGERREGEGDAQPGEQERVALEAGACSRDREVDGPVP